MAAPYVDPHLEIGVDRPPISQSPCQALRHKHFIITYPLSIIICFWINYGIAALVMVDYDRAGLWKSLGLIVLDVRRVYYLDSPLWVDLLVTCFCVVFFSALMAAPGARSALRKADALPIPSQELHAWRFLGLTLTNTILRSFVMALATCLTIYPLTLGFFAAACRGGSMPVYNEECYLEVANYMWMKAGWCGCIIVFVHPFIEMGSLNKDTLTEEDYDDFMLANERKFGREHQITSNIVVPASDSYHTYDNGSHAPHTF